MHKRVVRFILVTALGGLISGGQAFAHFGGSSSSTFPALKKSSKANYQPHIGVIGGVSSPDGPYDAAGEIGVEAGYQPYIPISLGAEVTTVEFDGDGVRPEINRTNILAKVAYNFGGKTMILRDSYVGLAMGPSFEEVGFDDDVHFGFMPNAGFDIPLEGVDENVTVGANLRYFVTTGDSPDAVALRGAVKYWF